MTIEGVLFLTAGYGTRVEPLSLVRPKALLPYGDTTILGKVAGQVRSLDPAAVRVNASRCPDRLLERLTAVWPECACRLYFEERPLGTSATIARNADFMEEGTWMIVNTDMIIDGPDLLQMLEFHRESGSDWTAMTGCFPHRDDYSSLDIDDEGLFGTGGDIPIHYWGISLMEPAIIGLAKDIQSCGGLFSELAGTASEHGGILRAWMTEGSWLDMGRKDLLRQNILSGGSFVHPTASVSGDAVLEGTWNIGPECIVTGGTRLSDSVMLEGSLLESGILENTVLPWFCSSSGTGGI